MDERSATLGWSFRPLQLEDMQMFHEWVHLPHVYEWWSEDALPLDRLVERYRPDIEGTGTARAYIVERNGAPFGYIQWYYLRDEPEWTPPMIKFDHHDIAVDLFVGDPEGVGLGLGVEMLRRFLRDVAFVEAPDSAYCWIDPDPPNARAIRAYEKVGFVPVALVERIVEGKRDPALIMRLPREKVLP